MMGVFPEDEGLVFQCTLALLLRYSLVDLYRPKFAKLGVVVWQFDKIVEGFLPKVHSALVKHGVNSEYYAIQWFMTLYASDLPQSVVRRIWDRFLIAGWRIVVQVGLALLCTVADMDTCHALVALRKFGKNCPYKGEELLEHASTFKVSHRMLSALEAAYNWDDDVQLIVVKDLNSGQVHWSVQAVKPQPPSAGPRGDEDEFPIELPRAFTRRDSQTSGVEDSNEVHGNVLPFLIRNLDTGDETVLNEAWSEYTDDISRRARAAAGPAQARPTVGERMQAVSSDAPMFVGPLSPPFPSDSSTPASSSGLAAAAAAA
eukprot:CAMPEP_0206614146 /NCGR_PEP_ID=MMETSP0325_2-20121206/57180_1 /ASSEMBLY_ACC=CAM_ASM_000347 /TAXON_ID=2866 /ORGANISM="Crypthecodinium cohnii, Strain Seligo" /LENGTH=315 /DNA_ID=CAMNT_0054134511 /DNA_START=1 /DNA_END=944 /DNA_ORIENTATION=-